MDFAFSGHQLRNLSQINVILGRNGGGKSTLLRRADTAARVGGAYVRYLSPERGGELSFDGNIDSAIQQQNWLQSTRSRNRNDNFRQISVSEFRRLETLVLRKIEKDPETRANGLITFETTIAKINDLLEGVELSRSDSATFEIWEKGQKGQAARQVADLSSGEAELISLGIEILAASYAAGDSRYAGLDNWLFLDEPDVHLHPDLQYKLIRLLAESIKDVPLRVLIATHSTAILGAVAEVQNVRVAFMGHRASNLDFEQPSKALKAVIPIFGAHPLSAVFNERPILLVEGEDDERIWQQAGRSSEGKIRIWPCVAGDIQSLQLHEEKVASIIGAIYDGARAYSLRDRDDATYEIDDLGPVVRMRLNCKAAENLLVTDDVLAVIGTDWDTLRNELERWLVQNPEHPQREAVLRFQNSGWERRDANLKPLRNIIMALAGSTKPWEVAVGQAIAALKGGAPVDSQMSLTSFLGPKLVAALDLKPPQPPAEAAQPDLVAEIAT